MKESVIYQEIRESGIEQGLQQGMQQGMQQGEATLVLRLLNRRLGQISEIIETEIRQLRVEQLENLGEALLDFENENDLLEWLANLNSQ